MAQTSVNVVIPKKGPSQALKDMSIANSPRTKMMQEFSKSMSAPSTGTNQALKNYSIANSPKDKYVNNLVSNSATPVTKPAPTNDFQSKLNRFQAEADNLQKMVNEYRERENATKTRSDGPSNSLREMSIALSPQTERPDYYAKSRSAMEAYIDSLKPTSDEEAAAKRIANTRSSISSGMQQASEQAIPMNFITGQQQAIENRGLNMLDPMESELERLIAQRTAESTGLSARAGFESNLADSMMADDRYRDETARDERRWAYGVAEDASKPIEIDGRLVRRNADGGYDEVYTPPPEAPELPEPFELSEGQSRYEYNPTTGKYEMIASKGKTYKAESGGGDKKSESRTDQIIDGFITFEDLTATERQEAQDELFELGFNGDAVPTWFQEYISDERQQSIPLDKLQSEWTTYRDDVLKKARTRRAGSNGFDFNAIPDVPAS